MGWGWRYLFWYLTWATARLAFIIGVFIYRLYYHNVMESDLLITLSSCLLNGAVFIQILKIYRQQSADQISWAFLSIYVIGLVLYFIAFILAKFWFSVVIIGVGIIEYVIIIIQKLYYKYQTKLI